MQPLLLLLLLDSATAAQDAADVVVAPELTAAAPTRSAMAASTKLRRPQKLAWRWRRQQYFCELCEDFWKRPQKVSKSEEETGRSTQGRVGGAAVAGTGDRS